MNRQWVRVYADILDDPKIAKLSAKCFKFFIFLLVFCAESGIGDKISDHAESICWRFRISKKAYDAAINELLQSDIIYFKNNELYIKNWLKRQYKSDSSTERVKRFRNVSETSSETPPETETETETETELEKKIIIKENFEKFYFVYPVKKGKAAAEKAFIKIIKNEKIKAQQELDEFVEKLINAINLQQTEHRLASEADRFRPDWKHPATWLNGECWLDEVDLKTIKEPKQQTKTTASENMKTYGSWLKKKASEESINTEIGGIEHESN